MVKKRLVNSITFFIICRQWEHGVGSVAAEVVAAAARQGWPAWRRRQQLGRSAILAVTGARLEMRRRRGGGGWLHGLLAIVAMDGDDNCNADCLSKKGVEQGIRREGIERWVCFFHAVLFCYCFLAYLFQCRSIDFYRCRCMLLLPSW